MPRRRCARPSGAYKLYAVGARRQVRRARGTWSAPFHTLRLPHNQGRSRSTTRSPSPVFNQHRHFCGAHTAQIIDESTGPHTISRRIPMTRDIRWSRMVLSRPDLAARRHVTLGLVGRSNYPYPICNQHGLRDAQRISRTTVVNAVCPLPTRHQACTFSGTPIPGIDAIRNPSPQRQNMRRPSACESSQHAEHATHKSIAASLCSLLMLARCQKARLEGGDGGVASPSPRSKPQLSTPLDPPSLSRTWPAGAMPTPSLTESCVGPPRAAATVVSPSMGSGAAMMGASRDVRVREEAHRTQRLREAGLNRGLR